MTLYRAHNSTLVPTAKLFLSSVLSKQVSYFIHGNHKQNVNNVNKLAVLNRKHQETLKTLIIGAMKNPCPALVSQSFGRVNEMASKCTREVSNLLFQINGFHFTVYLCLIRLLD